MPPLAPAGAAYIPPTFDLRHMHQSILAARFRLAPSAAAASGSRIDA